MLDDAVDKNDGDIAKVTSADYRKIVDLCWQCKLCYNHCPYTPPHKWDIDFPRLMLRAKAARAKEEGVTRQDAWLGNVDAVGRPRLRHRAPQQLGQRLRTRTALLLEAVGGHRPHAHPPQVPPQDLRPLVPRAGHGAASRRGPRSRFFFSCSVNYNEPQVGRDAVAVLEKNGCARVLPGAGLLRHAVPGRRRHRRRDARTPGRTSRRSCPWSRQGADVVVPQPTCSYVLKKEYPMLVPGRGGGEGRGGTQDLFEYLAGRQKEGTLDTEFPGRGPGRVAYQVPCHLRAQNMGFKTRDVLQLIPGTEVSVVEKCTAMDGTWGMKKEYYPISLEYAKKAVDEMDASAPETYMTDCTLSALQIEAVRGEKPGPSDQPAARGVRPPRGETMKKIERAELLNLAEYEKAREGMRAGVIALKKNRRVARGREPHLPVREPGDRPLPDPGDGADGAHRGRRQGPGRARRLQRPHPGRGRALGHALHRDPRPSPDGHDQVREAVNRFQGLDQDGVFLRVGDDPAIPARFEDGHSKEEKMAAVHYLRFRVPADVAARLATGDPARLVVDHPRYKAEALLPQAVRAELQADLDLAPVSA